jgi:tetratricopeptide (TPR) repeat protein
MSFSPELDRLAARWADQPDGTGFAPLAEGLRQRGALEQAAAIAIRGVAGRPAYLPGRLVLARIYRDQQRWGAADAELRAALAIDAEHPVVLDALDQLVRLREGPPESFTPAPAMIGDLETDQSDDESAGLVYSDDLADEASDPQHALVVTESLAMLYWGQGHHQQAIDAFDALIQRSPGNPDLVVRREAVCAEFDATRPTPFDATSSGGRSVRDWLGAVARVTAPAPRPVSGFDAFFQTTVVPSAPEPGDLAAFQAWLRELDR